MQLPFLVLDEFNTAISRTEGTVYLGFQRMELPKFTKELLSLVTAFNHVDE